nr:hypothetical protein [Sphingomonas panacisoli]
MTNGTAVVLGPVSARPGAGMTGRMAFVYDASGSFERFAPAASRSSGTAFVVGALGGGAESLVRAHERPTAPGRAPCSTIGTALPRDAFWQSDTQGDARSPITPIGSNSAWIGFKR